MPKTLTLLAFVFCLAATGSVMAQSGLASTSSTQQRVQGLKQEMLELDQALQALEDTLLVPLSTRTRLFLSQDVGEFFRLDAVEVKFDGRLVASHLYNTAQRKALRRGAAQTVYEGNLAPGAHEMTVVLTGVGPKEREYRLAKHYAFEKGESPKYLQLEVVDSEKTRQPTLTVNEW